MPRELDVEEMEPVSSTVLDQDETVAAPEKDTKTEDAGSSTATDEAKDTASIVRDVVDARTATAEPASSAEGEEDGEAPVAQTPKEPDNENFSDVPFHKHPRFQQLLREKKANEADATGYRNVQAFLHENALSAEEAGNMLTLVALAKRDPVSAWAQARPWVQNLLIAAGEVLPTELQQRVQTGELTQQAAIELSRTQAQVSSFEAQRRFDAERASRMQQAEQVTAVQSAAQSWENERRLKDPNFEAKVQPIMEKIAFFHATEGRPADAAGVRDQLERAYKAVNAQAKAAPIPAQRKPTIKPVLGGQVAGNAQPGADSTLDIIQRTVAARRA